MLRTRRPSITMMPPKQVTKRGKTITEQPKQTTRSKNKTTKTIWTKAEGKMMTKTTKHARTIEGKKSTKTTKATTIERKDPKPALLQTRCAISYFSKKMDVLRDLMSDECRAKISWTPFSHLLYIPKLIICCAWLKAILDRITLDNKVGIALGEHDIFVPLTVEHISLIVGSPMVGVSVNVKDNLKSKTFDRPFCAVEKMTKRMELCEKLFELLVGEDEDTTRDFSRVLVLFVCNCVLFLKT